MRFLVLALAFIAVTNTGCNRYEKNKSGIPFKLKKGERKVKLEHGKIVKLHFEYKLGDSVLVSTFSNLPQYFPIDTSRFMKYSFTDFVTGYYVGDEIEFKLSIDTLKKMGQLEYNDIFKRGQFVNGKVKYLQLFADEGAKNADFAKEVEAEKQKEIKQVKEYVAKKNYKAEYSANGVAIVIEKEGVGAKADSGKSVSVFYAGRLTSNEKEFDSNIKNGVKQQPINFILNSGTVIPGWDEGLKYFNKGAKGKIVIPAMMAYGMQGSPPVIPPYSNLVFDIEMADIKDTVVAPIQEAPLKDPRKK